MNNIDNILAFFNIFNRALTKKELEEFLNKEIKEQDLQKYQKKDDYYVLRSADKVIFKKTKENRQISENHLKKAEKYLPYLRFLPFVRAVAVCNTTSFYSADQKSDIDLFIITEKNHIWTARVFVTFFLHILGVRRYGNKIASRFCLSFFADTENLDLEKIKLKKDPFLAFWCASLVPIFGQKIFKKFALLNENWIKQEVGVNILLKNKKIKKDGGCFFLEIIFGKWFESLLKRFLLPRSLKKAKKLKNSSGTIITKGMLKFHDNDKREEFAERYYVSVRT